MLVYEAHLTAHINKQKEKLLSKNVWSTSDIVDITIKGYCINHKKFRISLEQLRSEDHGIAQDFIRWFLTAEVGVQYQGSPCGLFSRQSGNEAEFLRIILSSPCQLATHYFPVLSFIAQGWGKCVQLRIIFQGIYFFALQK
jgi:hypothetical protein